MQLSTIKISNLLSFPYVKNLTEIEWVKFHNSEEWVVNIIIGPNGSGKSNLLDIVHTMRKCGITINYNYDESTTNAITLAEQQQSNILTKYRWSEDLPAHVYFSLLLTQHDIDNLLFLNKNSEAINTIIKNYSNFPVSFHSVPKENLILHKKIPLYFTIDTNQQSILLRRHNLDSSMTLIYDYLQHFELIQICIQLHNKNIKETQERNWYPLHNTFAIITSHDRTNVIKPLKLFLKKYHSLVITTSESGNSLLGSFFLESVNITLKHYVDLSLHIQENETILFEDSDGQLLSYSDLSSGEQSFVSIILLIYAHDLQYGFMIIDEPEIHLHPQSQELFMELLEDMKMRQKMQFIIATHAPSMINEHNINHVFRCNKNHHATQISSPLNSISEDDATLLQMLKFDHIAKIFFVDTIILVEGDTDMYFFSHYINYLKNKSQRKNIIHNYEIITIGWKGWFKKWKNFLTKFGVHAHYIGDWDNIIEHGIIPSISKHISGHHKYRHPQWWSNTPKHSASKYEAAIAQMKQFQWEKYDMISEKIEELYAQHVYLLKEWDLEAYIWLPAKWLDDTVAFCQYDFLSWLEDSHYYNKRKELEDIVKRIFVS